MIYLDTSVAVPLFVRESASEKVAAWFAACAEPLIAADWILTEFAGVLALKVRRGELTAALAEAAWSEFASFSGTGVRLVPVSRKAFEQAARMVLDSSSGLRAGDSLHLAVAVEVGATGMATMDANLAVNSNRYGLFVPALE